MLMQSFYAICSLEVAMPITSFHRFVITFAGATVREAQRAEAGERIYHIVESPPQHWAIFENHEPVAMSSAQGAQLAQLLAALAPFPDPEVAPSAAGADGTWVTVVVQHASQQLAYRWWSLPPKGWAKLAAITDFVVQIADAPQAAEAERQKLVARQLFAHLAARDLAGMLALYHPDIQ